MAIEVITPRNRAAWLKARSRDVTASTVAALFGVHPFLTEYELWALKSGLISEPTEETAPMRRGRLLEQVAVQILREEHPDWIIDHNAADNRYYRDPAHRIGATPDVCVIRSPLGRGIVQIKSVEASVYRTKWLGEDGMPEVPLWIALQASVEAYLTKADFALVAPLVVGHGIELPQLEVPIVDGLFDEIADRVTAFWARVEAGLEPQVDYSRDADVIDRLHGYGDPGEERDLTGNPRATDIVAERGELARLLRDGQDRLDMLDTEMKALLGSAVIGHLAGGRKVTWRAQQRRDPASGRVSTFRKLTYPKP